MRRSSEIGQEAWTTGSSAQIVIYLSPRQSNGLTILGPGNTRSDSVQIRRQYNLHRLFVLSIYHPARGFDLFASSVASSERHELLLSARATLTLRRDDPGIWANWDLVVSFLEHFYDAKLIKT
jgi:hypothetical protein